MKTLTTVEEIKAEAKRDNDATFFVQLNKEVVQWLNSASCYGANRDLVPTNIDAWARRLTDKTWRMRACDMKINASCNWLIDGHHRVYAIDLMKAYGVCARMTVIPDDEAVAIFGDQDCVGSKRRLCVQAQLLGVKNSTQTCGIDAAWRLYVEADDTPSTLESVKAFRSAHSWFFDEGFVTMRFSKSKKPTSRCDAAFIYAVESRPDKANEIKGIWRRVIDGNDLRKGSAAYELRRKLFGGLSRMDTKELFLIVLKAIAMELENQPCFRLVMTDAQYTETADAWGLPCAGKSKIDHLVSKTEVRKFEANVRTEIKEAV